MAAHGELSYTDNWQCVYCRSVNLKYEVYCSHCNTPRNTQVLELAPETAYPNGPPLPYNTEYISPTAAVDYSEFSRERDPLDGPSVYAPPTATVYYGEDQLFDSLQLVVPYEEVPRPPNPALGPEHSVNSTDFDYAFLQMQDVDMDQFQSINQFINDSLGHKQQRPPSPERLQSEEFRFSLTESAKFEARQKLYPHTHPTPEVYPSLETITERENYWSSGRPEPISVFPVEGTGYLSQTKQPVPSPRTIPPTNSLVPVPAPRKPESYGSLYLASTFPPAPPQSYSPPPSHSSSPPPPNGYSPPPPHSSSPPPPNGSSPPPPTEVTPVKQTKSVWQPDATQRTSNETIKVDEIIAFLKEQKIEKFIDPSFYPSTKSLFINPISTDKGRFRKICWLRPGQFRTEACRRGKWSVMNHPNPADVYQGGLGNCWFLSALSIVAERERLVENFIITKEYNTQGIYQVCLCMCGKWEIVSIDDMFPCRSDNKVQIYSKAVRNQLWVCLVEKAAAKMYGCYEALNSGTLLEGLSTLTGAPCETINMVEMLQGEHIDPSEAKNVIWSHITYFNQSGFLMGVSTGSQLITDEVYSAVGLSNSHAYSILNISEMEGHRLLCLRDPNGFTHWRGDWSNRSPNWTREMRKALTPGGDGIFWISLDDICNYFTVIDVCKVATDCNEARESSEFPPDLQCFSPVYLVELFDKTELDVSIYQPNKRLREMKNEDKAAGPTDISVMILKTTEPVDETEGSCAPNASQLSGFTGRKKQCCVSKTFDLSAGVYIIAPQAYSHWSSERTVPYTLATFSSKAHIIQSRPSRPGFYAQALCILAEAKGRNIPTSAHGVKLYRLNSHQFLGDLLVVKNTSKEQHFTVHINYFRTYNVVATRGAGSVQDCIPPQHKQVLNLLTCDEVTKTYGIEYSIGGTLTQNNSMGEYGSISRPELTHKNRELHTPICI